MIDGLTAAFIPPAEVAAAIIAVAAMPVLLLIVGRSGISRLTLGRQFGIAMFGSIGVFVLLVAVLPSWGIGDAENHLMNLIAGVLLLFTGILIAFSVWSLLAYGFTISMLLSLAQNHTPMSLEEWHRKYGGVGVDQFAMDRMGVLLAFRLVQREGDRYSIVPGRGRVFASLVRLADVLFAIERDPSR